MVRRLTQGVAVLALAGVGVAFIAGWPFALVTVAGLLLLDLVT